MRTFPSRPNRRHRILVAAAGLFGLAFVPGLPVTAPSQAQSVDIEAIFNCNAGGPLGEQSPEQCVASRTVIMTSCTSCHTFVPIVKAQKTPEAWDGLLQIHRARVEQISDGDYQQLKLFLTAHFNPQNPVPALPPELEALGTNTPE